jgi:hypothetical protein
MVTLRLVSPPSSHVSLGLGLHRPLSTLRTHTHTPLVHCRGCTTKEAKMMYSPWLSYSARRTMVVEVAVKPSKHAKGSVLDGIPCRSRFQGFVGQMAACNTPISRVSNLTWGDRTITCDCPGLSPLWLSSGPDWVHQHVLGIDVVYSRLRQHDRDSLRRPHSAAQSSRHCTHTLSSCRVTACRNAHGILLPLYK